MIQIKLVKGQNNQLQYNGYTVEEEGKIYDDIIQDVIDHTRWYLDNLHRLEEIRLSWKNYKYRTATCPLKFVKKQKSL